MRGLDPRIHDAIQHAKAFRPFAGADARARNTPNKRRRSPRKRDRAYVKIHSTHLNARSPTHPDLDTGARPTIIACRGTGLGKRG
jgi:hypothetical protein